MGKGSNGRAFRIGLAGPKLALKREQRVFEFIPRLDERKGRWLIFHRWGDVPIGDENRFDAVHHDSELDSLSRLIRHF